MNIMLRKLLHNKSLFNRQALRRQTRGVAPRILCAWTAWALCVEVLNYVIPAGDHATAERMILDGRLVACRVQPSSVNTVVRSREVDANGRSMIRRDVRRRRHRHMEGVRHG
jgi:hypothetical protein